MFHDMREEPTHEHQPDPAVAPIALQPGEGEARWFLGVLATIKTSAESTGGRVA